MLKLFREGKADFYASEWQNESAATPVFYNPVMKLNRDVAVWIVKQLKPKRICLGMEASGIRAIRMAIEANVSDIVANDIGKEAFEAMKKNIELNNAADKIKAENKNVKELLSEGNLYDYIDIDPFGTPVYYAENAIKSLADNGILAVTATDTSCLCGSYVKACIRKYGSKSLNNEFNKETGLRILVYAMQAFGLKQGMALLPVFCHSSNHYMRAYLRCNASETALNEVKQGQGYILFCPKCLNRIVSNSPEGVCCGKPMEYAGPLWLGKLWENKLASSFDLIPYIQEESRIDIPWHFDSHRIAKLAGKQAVKHDMLIVSLQKNGFKASRTHFKPEGIKTDASIKDLIALF
ncbi:MAG: tRNA (guanine(26)-N(2))-dimethyltransferase [Candidatus Nanoarchaeia archaeon]|nr:tRNA (guanine(26)-N(2))-dimethyltransferase [Candidatus Nanoarchaeia archaeon]